MKSLKDIIKTFKEMDLETIQMWKWASIVLVVINIFGVYWYLQLRQLGIALMVVILGFFTIFLILESRKAHNDAKEEIEEENKKKSFEEIFPKKKNSKEDIKMEIIEDDGFPNPEEYNKNLEKALGKGF